MNYLFRGQILNEIEERGDLTVGKRIWFKTEDTVKTYNFKKFAKQLDEEDDEVIKKIDSDQQYYDLVSKLKEKYY